MAYIYRQMRPSSVDQIANCSECVSFLDLATHRRAAIATAFRERVGYFFHLAKMASVRSAETVELKDVGRVLQRDPWACYPTLRPPVDGNYGRAAAYLRSKGRGAGARRRAFEGEPRTAARRRGRLRDELYNSFKGFADHVRIEVPADALERHLEDAVQTFLDARPDANFDALSVISVLFSVAPDIRAVERWSGQAAVELYGRFVHGMTGRLE